MIDVETAYRLWSESYDADRNRTRDIDAAILRAHGPEMRGRDIVELGCGTGKNSVWLAETSRSLVALDLSEPMLARARARVERADVRFVRHDLRAAWPLADAAADLIVGNLVLEHVRDLRFVFGEAARVLRPGGELFISELHPYRQWLGSGAKIAAHGDARVEAYVHETCEYVNDALASGFALVHLGEWRDPEPSDGAATTPRLLTLHFRGANRTTSGLKTPAPTPTSRPAP